MWLVEGQQSIPRTGKKSNSKSSNYSPELFLQCNALSFPSHNFSEERGFLILSMDLLLPLFEVPSPPAMIPSCLSSPSTMPSFFHWVNDNNNNNTVKMLSSTYQSDHYIFHLSPNPLNSFASSISNYFSLHLILASSLNPLLTRHSLTWLITHTCTDSKAFVHFSSYFPSPK